MTVQSAALALAMGFGLIAGACNSDSGSPSAAGGTFNGGGTVGVSGTTSTSGGMGSGGGASCTNVAPCGGNAIGTWTVTSSCLKVSGELDLSSLGSCKSAPITGSLQVTGTWTANANGTSLDNTMTTGTEQITLGPACLVISSTPVSCEGAANLLKNLGYASLTCTTAGDGCACSGTIQQAGGLALLSPAPSKNSNYSTSASDLTITGDIGDAKYSYCTAATRLTLTPHSTNPTVTGTVVLQSDGAAGGAGGTNATAGSGGVGGTSQGGTVGTAGNAGVGGTNGTAGASNTPGPCDIYKTGGTPCVAAHSTVRALSQSYGGKLYQVRNAAGMTKDINAVTPGGVADAAGQDTFCMGTTCVITIIYDQSGKGNDLFSQDASSPVGGKDKPASATGESIKLGGGKAYSLYINPGNSYWADASKKGIPLGAEPEGMYMVASGTHFNSGCCFDYGNSELDRKADGAGAMDALNLSNTTAWGSGAGNGPWVMADLEYGLFAQSDTKTKNPNDPSQTAPFVTAVLKNNGKTEFALRGGNAAAGNLSTYYKGALPGGWSPMKKQGAIILGSGGDCCATNNNLSMGTFYEGCIVTGYPTDATEDAVQANIVAAMYSK